MTFLSQIIFFCVSADMQDRSPEEHSNSRYYQRTLMHNLLSSPTNTSWEQNYRNLIQRAVDPQDECQWRGVECDKGIMTHFLCADFMLPDVCIRMRMLPSTIQFLHLQRTRVHDGWSAATLPRDLEYVYMSLDFPHRTNADFHRLPLNIEELHAIQENWYGPINLTGLPEGLKIFNIGGQMRCTPIVDSMHISKNLKRVSVSAWKGSTAKRMHSVDGGEIDTKIFIFRNNARFHLADSQYWDIFSVELRRIRDEYDAMI